MDTHVRSTAPEHPPTSPAINVRFASSPATNRFPQHPFSLNKSSKASTPSNPERACGALSTPVAVKVNASLSFMYARRERDRALHNDVDGHQISDRVLRCSDDGERCLHGLGLSGELRVLTGQKEVRVPVEFVKGRLIRGAEEVMKLKEDGKLGSLLKGIPRGMAPCNGCGGMRFVMCMDCNGSCKVLGEDQKKMTVDRRIWIICGQTFLGSFGTEEWN
ncbi:hypothetical protein ACLOJK_017987 [Asimina triloba]